MVNNSKKDINLRVGKKLAEARLCSGLTLAEVEKVVETMRAQVLEKIEKGQLSVSCSEIYELLELYPESQNQRLYFCSMSSDKEGNE